MPKHQEATRLNEPMVARLHKCAADTSPNWDGKITIYPPEARELTALIIETEALRGIADEAAYYRGAQECQDGECEHLDDPAEGEPCPILDERYATADDVLRAQAFEEALDEIAGLLDSTPDQGLRDYIRSAIQRGKTVAAELAPSSSRPNMSCSCCGRQVAPLDDDRRCGHCGVNRDSGTHEGDKPCQPTTGSAPNAGRP